MPTTTTETIVDLVTRVTAWGASDWWTRRLIAEYVPPVTLSDLSDLPVLAPR